MSYLACFYCLFLLCVYSCIAIYRKRHTYYFITKLSIELIELVNFVVAEQHNLLEWKKKTCTKGCTKTIYMTSVVVYIATVDNEIRDCNPLVLYTCRRIWHACLMYVIKGSEHIKLSCLIFLFLLNLKGYFSKTLHFWLLLYTCIHVNTYYM